MMSESKQDSFQAAIEAMCVCTGPIGPLGPPVDIWTDIDMQVKRFAQSCSTAMLLTLMLSARHLATALKLRYPADDLELSVLQALNKKQGTPKNDRLIYEFLSESLINDNLHPELEFTCLQAIGCCTSISEIVVQFLLDQAKREDKTEDYRIVAVECISEMISPISRQRLHELVCSPECQSGRLKDRLRESLEFIASIPGSR